MTLRKSDFGGPLSTIQPRNGWAIHFEGGHTRSGQEPSEYVAIHEGGAHAVLNHCRFRFNPTQERWNWLVNHEFTLPIVNNGVLMPFTDWDIDTAIEKEGGDERAA